MATKKISELDAANALAGGELFPAVQDSTTRKVTTSQLATFVATLVPPGPTGATGATGPAGPAGPVGPEGPAGVDGAVLSVNGATGAVVLDDSDIKSPITVVGISAGTATVDCSLGRNFILFLNQNVSTLSLTNLAGSGYATEVEIEIKQDGVGGRTLALPPQFKALGGSDTAIASAINAVTVLSAKTFDNGTTWRYAMQESA